MKNNDIIAPIDSRIVSAHIYYVINYVDKEGTEIYMPVIQKTMITLIKILFN